MFVADLVVAMISAFIIVLIVSMAFETKGPWGSLFWFFLVVSLFAWSGGVWIVPFGPHWRGMVWFPIILMGFLVSLLLVSASPRRSRKRPEDEQKAATYNQSFVAIDVVVWVVIVCLIVMGIGHYAWTPRLG
jgi:hypothetical protein